MTPSTTERLGGDVRAISARVVVKQATQDRMRAIGGSWAKKYDPFPIVGPNRITAVFQSVVPFTGLGAAWRCAAMRVASVAPCPCAALA
jgi:hypothetical protein